ncbi:MAG: septum site-determining protein MinC [Fretibacterium sp.]|nr:septum site-determining protein MinC [Fretibacterium sp.]
MKLKIARRRNTQKRGAAAQINMERTHYGIRIAMPESPDEGVLLELLSRIPTGSYLLPEGEGIVLDFRARACSPGLLLRLLQVMWEKEVRVLAWLSTKAESIRLFRGSGFSVMEPPADLPPAPAVEPEPQQERKPRRRRLKFIPTSMRSGQSVRAQGDVILWGHLNSGAEIVAGGSVVVAGRLRGLVHAGQGDQEDAFVLAGSFETAQVRLGHKICYADAATEGWKKPVLITLEDGTPTIRENTAMNERGRLWPF